MSILIPGMEMPKDCRECPLFGYAAEDDFMCLIQDGEDACPLIELPPHGRLGDLDALYAKTVEWEATALDICSKLLSDKDVSEWKRWSAILAERSAFKFDVADAPTIIPADKEDTP